MLFSGDHIMEGSTVVIRPPDGDMAAYLEQLERLKAWRPRLRSIAPGHGHLIEQPIAKIDEYLDHRRSARPRCSTCVQSGTHDASRRSSTALYPDLIDELVPMAEGTVWAHLLQAQGRRARCKGKSPAAVAGVADVSALARRARRRRLRACGRCSRPSRPAGWPR